VITSSSTGHEIIPQPGSARRVRDGEPASLLDPRDYPIEALCLECGQPIRCERWFLGGWAHIERFSNPPPASRGQASGSTP
jgi:hypothetical protein